MTLTIWHRHQRPVPTFKLAYKSETRPKCSSKTIREPLIGTSSGSWCGRISCCNGVTKCKPSLKFWFRCCSVPCWCWFATWSIQRSSRSRRASNHSISTRWRHSGNHRFIDYSSKVQSSNCTSASDTRHGRCRTGGHVNVLCVKLCHLWIWN